MNTLTLEKNSLSIRGRITIDVYRAGMVEAVTPFLDAIRMCKKLLAGEDSPIYREHLLRRIERNKAAVEELKAAHFIERAREVNNLIMDSSGYGLDLIIQRLVGINTYSLNILYGEIGTGATAPALSDMGLTAPTNRAAVGFQQDYGATDAILQFFFSDSQLANETYNEFGTFVGGTSTIGTGQLFNHALISPGFAKTSGTDVTVQCDISLVNS